LETPHNHAIKKAGLQPAAFRHFVFVKRFWHKELFIHSINPPPLMAQGERNCHEPQSICNQLICLERAVVEQTDVKSKAAEMPVLAGEL
jgi:hypothetical protein